MSTRDMMIVGILAVALFSITVVVFSAPIGISTKTYGAIAFGLILLFGALNLFFAWREKVRSKSNQR